jgi:hypothetical protein
MDRHLLTSGAIAVACLAVGASAAAMAAESRAPVPAEQSGVARGRAPMRFEVMDRNRDGRVSRDEWRGSPRSFDVHDWNDDGVLSGDEVRADRRGPDQDPDQADHLPSSAERYMAWTDRAFANLDHDRNRRITPNEWHYDRETFARVDHNRDGSLDRVEFIGGDMDDDRGDQFADLDGDGDGRVERGEWHASDDAFTWLDRNRDGVLSRVEVVGSEDRSSARDQFTSLDVDGDRRLSRDEWHWSAGSFGQRDLNRDGWLTRQEFASTAAETAQSTRDQRTIDVDARQRWTDSSLDVRSGDVLSISARGTIVMSGDDRDTATPAGSRTGRGAQQAPIQAVAGALIARIDSGAPFLIGDQSTVKVPASGRLYLGVNDDHLQDNRGHFQVTVSVQSGRWSRR